MTVNQTISDANTIERQMFQIHDLQNANAGLEAWRDEYKDKLSASEKREQVLRDALIEVRDYHHRHSFGELENCQNRICVIVRAALRTIEQP